MPNLVEDQLLETMNAILERITALPAQLRTMAVDAEWAQIPFHVKEGLFVPGLAAGTVLTFNPQTSGLELIQYVLFSVPTGATGTIVLGDMQIPVGAGTGILSPVSILLASGDLRSLTLAGGNGNAALWLMGRQQPTYGALAK